MGMSRTTQLFDAAAVLSDLLTQAGIAHAFAGNFESVALGGPERDTEVRFHPTACRSPAP
jgi:TctA family transporter